MELTSPRSERLPDRLDIRVLVPEQQLIGLRPPEVVMQRMLLSAHALTAIAKGTAMPLSAHFSRFRHRGDRGAWGESDFVVVVAR